MTISPINSQFNQAIATQSLHPTAPAFSANNRYFDRIQITQNAACSAILDKVWNKIVSAFFYVLDCYKQIFSLCSFKPKPQPIAPTQEPQRRPAPLPISFTPSHPVGVLRLNNNCCINVIWQLFMNNENYARLLPRPLRLDGHVVAHELDPEIRIPPMEEEYRHLQNIQFQQQRPRRALIHLTQAFREFISALAQGNMISANSVVQEDAFEVYSALMNFLHPPQNQNPIPAPFFTLDVETRFENPEEVRVRHARNEFNIKVNVDVFLDPQRRNNPAETRFETIFENQFQFEVGREAQIRRRGQLIPNPYANRNGMERTYFQTAPGEFMVTLARFAYNRRLQRPIKIENPIPIPQNYQLPAHLTRDGIAANYELDFFIEHAGMSANSGHYIAYRKINGIWLRIDDDRVTRITREQAAVAIANSYMVHYKKIP